MLFSDCSSDVCSSDLLRAINVASVWPCCAIGLFIGTLVGGQGAPALLNLLYLPMAFLSGLWLPLEMLPQLFATLAPTWPPYHLAQLALRVVGMDGGGSMVVHVAMPVAVTVVFRSEEHTSELQSLMRISYAVLCLKKKTKTNNQ